jgi:hypothetical protein
LHCKTKIKSEACPPLKVPALSSLAETQLHMPNRKYIYKLSTPRIAQRTRPLNSILHCHEDQFHVFNRKITPCTGNIKIVLQTFQTLLSPIRVPIMYQTEPKHAFKYIKDIQNRDTYELVYFKQRRYLLRPTLIALTNSTAFVKPGWFDPKETWELFGDATGTGSWLWEELMSKLVMVWQRIDGGAWWWSCVVSLEAGEGDVGERRWVVMLWWRCLLIGSDGGGF